MNVKSVIDITDAKKDFQPEDLFFSSGDMKEFQIFQYNNNTVRIILNFNNSYNTSNLKVGNINNNIIITIRRPSPYNLNYYINTYRENDQPRDYKEDLMITERTMNKLQTPVSNAAKVDKNSLNDINRAFSNSTYSTNEMYTEYKVNNLTVDKKLRSILYKRS